MSKEYPEGISLFPFFLRLTLFIWVSFLSSCSSDPGPSSPNNPTSSDTLAWRHQLYFAKGLGPINESASELWTYDFATKSVTPVNTDGFDFRNGFLYSFSRNGSYLQFEGPNSVLRAVHYVSAPGARRILLPSGFDDMLVDQFTARLASDGRTVYMQLYRQNQYRQPRTVAVFNPDSTWGTAVAINVPPGQIYHRPGTQEFIVLTDPRLSDDRRAAFWYDGNGVMIREFTEREYWFTGIQPEVAGWSPDGRYFTATTWNFETVIVDAQLGPSAPVLRWTRTSEAGVWSPTSQTLTVNLVSMPRDDRNTMSRVFNLARLEVGGPVIQDSVGLEHVATSDDNRFMVFKDYRHFTDQTPNPPRYGDCMIKIYDTQMRAFVDSIPGAIPLAVFR